jgi:hypothetical protein
VLARRSTLDAQILYSDIRCDPRLSPANLPNRTVRLTFIYFGMPKTGSLVQATHNLNMVIGFLFL